MTDPDYRQIVAHYEDCLDRHGDSHLGVDWPRLEDVETRYRVMLGVIRPDRPDPSLLDFGCGAGHLYDYLSRDRSLEKIHYIGLDLSSRFIDLCRSKHPGVDFLVADLMKGGVESLPRTDYVVANGVFTEKRDLTFNDMLGYFEALVPRIFDLCNVGIAFNVMSKQVDWEREDLFHLPFDILTEFLTRRVTRHFAVRHDYGLYEYTVYAYREPGSWPGSSFSA